MPGMEMQVTVLETEELSETAKLDILNSGAVEMQENGPNPGPANTGEVKEEDKQEERQEWICTKPAVVLEEKQR